MATRRERVVLELDDQFTGQIAKAAAAAQLFQQSLGKTRTETDRTSKSLQKVDADTKKMSASITRSIRDLDSFSGRAGLLARAVGAIGPAAIPITAVAIPAVTGLSQQLGFAALAGGTAVLAFQGVGDALEAMNKAHLEPTAANLEKAREAMERLSPAARDLVRQIGSMRDEFKKLKDAAGSGILPGATAALQELENRLPIVERILRQISTATGDALREGAQSLAGPEWDRFFKFIATEARPELAKFAKTVGNLAHGFAELWVAFGPLNSSFSSWLLDSARAFDDWATGLSATEGFQDFVIYLRENGPRVGEAVKAIANALLQIVEAAAPIGGPILEALTTLADVIAAIADSDLGMPIFGMIAAFSALSLATKAWSGIAGSSVARFVVGQQQARASILATVSAQQRATMSVAAMGARQAATRRQMAGMGAQAAVLGLMMTGVTDKVGLSNTAMLGLAGSLAGPWGAAAGAAIGLTMDLTKVNDGLADSIDRAGQAAANPQGIQQLLAARRDLVAQFADVANDDSGPFGFGGKMRRSISFLSGDVGETEDAIAGLDRQIAASRGVNARYQAALGLTDRGFQLATASAEGFSSAVSGLNSLLSKRASLRDYQAALDDFTAGLKTNGRTLDINTEKGRANQANLDAIVNATLKAAEGMKGSNRIEFLKQARQDILDMGGKLEGGKAQAEKLTQAIEDLDKKKAEPTIDVNTRDAFAQLSVFEQKLAGLTGKKRTVYINTVHQSIFNPAAGSPGQGLGVLAPKGNKDGGFQRGPGGPRDDLIPAWLSNGEFVVNAAATARNRGWLEQINAQKFADGGYAMRDAQSRQSHHSSATKMTVDFGEMRVVGTLNTPWGPAQVEGIARAAARSEVNDSASLDRTHARMYRGGVRG